MNKPRKTPVPLPGTKANPKASPKKAQLSQEFVNSSDDSADDVPPQSRAAQSKPPTSIAVHRPKVNGNQKSTSSPTKKRNGAKEATSAKGVTPRKVQLKTIVVEEQGASSSSSSEESEVESAVEEMNAQQGRAKKIWDKALVTSSDSETSSEESDSEEASPAVNKSPAISRPAPVQVSHAVEFQQQRPYVPPKGFAPAPTIRTTLSSSAAILENLEGKEIWHITAPADLSLKDLKEVAMKNALNGEAILHQKGTDYGLSAAKKADCGSCDVMIPTGNGYKTVSTPVSQTLHVREVINLPELDLRQAAQTTGSEAAAAITRSTIRAPRPQVKGLKMRYFPSGFGHHAPITLGSSDSEEETQPAPPAGLGIPNGVHLPQKPEKRKHKHTDGDERMESPTKKHKKHRTPEEIKAREEKKAKKERKRERETAKSRS